MAPASSTPTRPTLSLNAGLAGFPNTRLGPTPAGSPDPQAGFLAPARRTARAPGQASAPGPRRPSPILPRAAPVLPAPAPVRTPAPRPDTPRAWPSLLCSAHGCAPFGSAPPGSGAPGAGTPGAGASLS